MARSLVLVLCLVLAAPALAQSSTQVSSTSVPDTGSAKTVKHRKICRETVPTGSRLNAVRQCATAEEWERMYRDQRENLERKQDIGLIGPK